MSESWWKRQSKQNVKRLAELRVEDRKRDEVNEVADEIKRNRAWWAARAAAVDVRR
jgi:hypothetical protein